MTGPRFLRCLTSAPRLYAKADASGVDRWFTSFQHDIFRGF